MKEWYLLFDSSDVNIFDILVEPVQQSIKDKGMVPLTEPQKLAIPQIMSGKNVLIISPTGMGKTEAVLVPIINEMLRLNLKHQKGVKVLYITPLRALNRDLLDRIAWWASRHDFSVAVRHGDSSKSERRSQTLKPPDVLVTTPETFQIILVGRRLREHLSTVRWIIIDELHEIASDKRGSQLSLGLERLKVMLKHDPQILGLSATVGKPEELASFLTGNIKKCEIITTLNPKQIEIKLTCPRGNVEDSKAAEFLMVHLDVAARINKIISEILSHKSVLVFTNTRSTAETISNKIFLLQSESAISIHHGSLGSSTRMTAETGLKSGTLKGVITTSSLELGIDVGLIDFVIQYGSPRQATHLIQRVGRSGHKVGMISKGEIITLDPDDSIEALVVRNRALLGKIESIEPPPKPYDVLAHQILGLLFFESRISFDDLISIFSRSYPYKDLLKDDVIHVLEFMQSRYPSLITYYKEQNIISRGRSSKEIFEYYFQHISTIPEIRHYPVFRVDNNEMVGELDEEFIAEKGIIGTRFIMAGRVWSLTHITEGKVFVNHVDDSTGAIPSWSGEEIPVPFEIANEVGEMRAGIVKMLKGGMSPSNIALELAKLNNVDIEFAQEVITDLVQSCILNYEVATNKIVVVEKCLNMTILHVCLGDRANRSLSKLIGSYYSRETGTTITANRDPYRVIILYDLPSEMLIDMLKKITTNDIENLLSFGLESFGMFKWRLLHVARRFGVIKKEVDLTTFELDNLTRQLRDTVVFEEAKKELFHKDYDLSTLKFF